MSSSHGRFELKTSLSISGSREDLDTYVAILDEAIARVLLEYPAVSAYYAVGDPESVEIEVGLRFEGIAPKYIEDVADEILTTSIESATQASVSGAVPVREESTLVPA